MEWQLLYFLDLKIVLISIFKREIISGTQTYCLVVTKKHSLKLSFLTIPLLKVERKALEDSLSKLFKTANSSLCA